VRPAFLAIYASVSVFAVVGCELVLGVSTIGYADAGAAAFDGAVNQPDAAAVSSDASLASEPASPAADGGPDGPNAHDIPMPCPANGAGVTPCEAGTCCTDLNSSTGYGSCSPKVDCEFIYMSCASAANCSATGICCVDGANATCFERTSIPGGCVGDQLCRTDAECAPLHCTGKIAVNGYYRTCQ
jgi:hypothetical protein